MTRNRLYLLLAFGLLAGYGWIIWFSSHSTLNHTYPACLFKSVTGIACPSCGSTRSVVLVSQGNITDAILLNPIGPFMAVIMLIAPFWLFYDTIFKKDSLYKSYRTSENIIKTKWVAITLIILLLLNWLWNIQKGL
ncbi:DUF2752 domain-containing protein [Flavobacterium sp. NRK1]|uniref:DUF2752 domain-containing protein n=1 Tax=Flavobacterium sp. NRK1 TaxID=2954929 RepID=UPI002093791E|nr:DUF2752 domain-containing protein [Flavobacterium sp. NRK1]MCO6148836.1 DUF2752 domain-containing protein [Flavobacterium sp. NRK1]